MCTVANYRDKRIRWQAVSQILTDEKYIYISDSVVAHIIPKSSFTIASEAQSFLNSATEYWQAAKRMPLETADGVWPPAPRMQV
jgi:hypothetical protein